MSTRLIVGDARGASGGDIAIERRGGHIGTMRNLRDGNIGISEHRLRGCEFRTKANRRRAIMVKCISHRSNAVFLAFYFHDGRLARIMQHRLADVV
jgi:hypothetical protein